MPVGFAHPPLQEITLIRSFENLFRYGEHDAIDIFAGILLEIDLIRVSEEDFSTLKQCFDLSFMIQSLLFTETQIHYFFSK